MHFFVVGSTCTAPRSWNCCVQYTIPRQLELRAVCCWVVVLVFPVTDCCHQGQNVVTASAAILNKADSQAQYGGSFTSTTLCVAGDLPNTLAITPTWSAVTRPYVVLTDE